MNDIERKRRDNNNNNSNIFSRKMVSSSETSRVKMKPCFKAGLNLPGKKKVCWTSICTNESCSNFPRLCFELHLNLPEGGFPTYCAQRLLQCCPKGYLRSEFMLFLLHYCCCSFHHSCHSNFIISNILFTTGILLSLALLVPFLRE